MYEMEGASEPQATPAVRSLGPRIRGARHHHPAEPRRTPVDSVPASRKGAFPGRLASLGKPCRDLWAPGTRSRELPVLVLADPEVSLLAGPPSLVTREISSAAGRPAQEPEGAPFKIL